MEIIDRIRELCRKNGISVTKLEAALGYGNGSISKASTTAMRSDRLKAIADFFHVTMEYLMTGKDFITVTTEWGASDELPTTVEIKRIKAEWEAATPAEIEYFEKEAATPHPITKREEELLEVFHKLSADQQEEVLRYGQFLYEKFHDERKKTSASSKEA